MAYGLGGHAAEPGGSLEMAGGDGCEPGGGDGAAIEWDCRLCSRWRRAAR